MSKVIRLKQVIDRTGLSRSTIYEMMKAGAFPERVSLGLRSVGWHESEIDKWIAARMTKSSAMAE
jgi:prophage regulatory protein